MKTGKIPKSTRKNPNAYKCTLCPYSSKRKDHFQNHAKTHSNQKPFKCSQCPYRSNHEKNVKQHLKTVHDPHFRPFPCQHPGCSYAAKQKLNLILHSKTHSSEISRSFKCSHSNCEFSSNYKARLVEHIRIHTGEKPYKCQFESCSYAAVSVGQLVSHTRSHTKERPYKCREPNCDYSTAQAAHLKQHQLIQHPTEGKQCPSFSCPVDGCPYTTKRANNLKGHLVVHSDSFFQCDSCPFQTRWKEALQKHAKRIHPSENSDPDSDSRPFKCKEPNCMYAAKVKQDLTSHARIHVTEIVFRCPEEGCNYSSNVKVNLQRHQERHKGEENYACRLCLNKFRESKGLKTHIANVHTKERPFKCQFEACSFTAVHKRGLNLHEVVHSNERNYSCQLPGCSYSSKTSHGLSKHFKFVHGDKNNNRPFKCAICPFAAKTRQVLTNHKKNVHSDARPLSFKCPELGCLYPGAKTRGNYLAHMATHNQEKKLKRPQENCGYKTNVHSNLQMHLKTMHVKSKEFKCSICKYSSKFKGNLSTHVKRHTLGNSVHSLSLSSDGMKKCWVCNCGFNTNYELSRDLKSHTNKQP